MIDPPGWDEGAVIPEISLGKNCARLDLERRDDRARFEALLAEADLLVHGYRPGALDELGYGESARRALNPALIDGVPMTWDRPARRLGSAEPAWARR